MLSRFHYSYRLINPHVTLWEMRGEPDVQGWTGMLAEAGRFLIDLETRGRRMGVVIDPSELTHLDASQRRQAGQWRAENMALIANVVPCGCYVAQNAWLRGAITAIFWIAAPIVPAGVKRSRQEAVTWVEEQLALAHSQPPPGV